MILAYEIWRQDWAGDQEQLIAHAKTLSDYWQMDHKGLVTSLRHLMATRDSCMQRQSFKKSLDLWLAVLKDANVVSIEDPGIKILCSYLVGQTQAAFCERTFAQVVEIQKLVRSIFLISSKNIPWT